MPNCFQLLDRTTGKATSFNEIDEKMCVHFGVMVDPKRYYMDWYDVAGFQVAMGKDLPKQIENGRKWVQANPTDNHAIDFLAVLQWLDEHYTTDAWVEVGKRV